MKKQIEAKQAEIQTLSTRYEALKARFTEVGRLIDLEMVEEIFPAQFFSQLNSLGKSLDEMKRLRPSQLRRLNLGKEQLEIERLEQILFGNEQRLAANQHLEYDDERLTVMQRLYYLQPFAESIGLFIKLTPTGAKVTGPCYPEFKVTYAAENSNLEGLVQLIGQTITLRFPELVELPGEKYLEFYRLPSAERTFAAKAYLAQHVDNITPIHTA